ncbi:MAG TPA: lipid II flippase MurJ [Candidatus Paceibacterota bacterium]
MVSKLLAALGREIKGLHEAAYLLGTFAILSQILALGRDKLLAYMFGASAPLDVYYGAFRIPDVLFVSIGSLVSASVLLPYFIDRFNLGAREGKEFLQSIFSVFLITMISVCVVLFFLLPVLLRILIPGLADGSHFNDLLVSSRIMLLSPFLLGLSNLFSSITQMRQRFLVFAASPVVYNIGIILGILFFYPTLGIPGLAWGVALGALLHVGIQLPFMASQRLLPRLSLSVNWSGVRSVIATSFPRTLTLSANQLASFFLVSLASLMAPGSIAVFTLAFNLQSVPLTVIGASYSSAVFPALSKHFVDGNRAAFLEKVVSASRHIIFWVTPMTVLFIVLRAQIVRVVYGAGKFDWSDTRLTAAVLAVFIVSAVGQSMVTLFVRAYYAEGKTSRPLIINITAAVAMVLLGYLLTLGFKYIPLFAFFWEELLKISGQAGTTVLALPLAFTFGILLNTLFHWVMFEHDYPGYSKPVLATAYHSFASSVIMGYAAFLGLRVFSFFPLEQVWGLFLQGFCAGVLGIIVGIMVLVMLQNQEIAEVWRALHHKIWKEKVIVPEQEAL